jgi:hypothetical protein
MSYADIMTINAEMLEKMPSSQVIDIMVDAENRLWEARNSGNTAFLDPQKMTKLRVLVMECQALLKERHIEANNDGQTK